MKIKKLLITFTIIISLFIAVSPTITTFASEIDSKTETTNQETQKQFSTEQLEKELSSYIYVDENGHINFSGTLPITFRDKYSLDVFQERFDSLNAQVDNGEVRINDDLSVTNLGFTILASSGHTTKNYWWGTRHTFTKKSSYINYIYELNNATLVVAAGALLPGLGVPMGLSAVYIGKVANDLQYFLDSKGFKNGILLDYNITLFYSIYHR